MATGVIDALVVTLGLDASHFRTGQKQASEDLKKTRLDANSAAKEISASGKQAAEFFGRIRNEALSLAAVFLGGMGIKALVQNLTSTDAVLGRLSRNLDIAPEKLSAWQAVVEQAGGSAQGLTSTVQGLTEAYQHYLQTGEVTVGPILAQFGITDPNELKDVPALLMKIGDAAAKMNRQRALSLMKQAGIDEGTSNFLLKPHDVRARELAEAERTSAPHKKDTDAAEALEKAFLKVKQEVMNVATEIVTNLTPKLLEVLKAVNDWLSDDKNRKWLGEEIERIGTSIGEFLTKLNSLVEKFGGWKVVIEALVAINLGAWALGVLAVFGPLGVAAGAVALAMEEINRLGTTGILGGPGNYPVGSPLWRDMPVEEQLRYPNSPASQARGAGTNPNPFSWWNPGSWLNRGGGGVNTGGNGSTAIDPQTRTRAEMVKQGLMARGMDADTATAFAANAIAESGARPDAMENGGGPGRGLFQITSASRKADYMRLYNHSPEQGSLAEQLDFVKWELENTERGAAFRIAGAQGAAAKAAAVSKFFERPRDVDAQQERRAAIARGLAGASGLDPSLIPRAGPRAGTSLGTTNTSMSDTRIGAINIHTAATDATGIARSIGPAMQRFGLVSQANSGLA
jgi:hypothetical protein